MEWHRRRSNAAPVAPPPPREAPTEPSPAHAEPCVDATAALPTYWLPPHARRRVTIVCDGTGSATHAGAVGNALILCALLANRRGADLRVVTRTTAPVPAEVDRLWRANGIELDRESQFVFAPPHDRRTEIDLLPDEIVLTTSWQTTAAALPSVPASQVVYLLQEDERLSCPSDEARARCEAVIGDPGIRIVVNTRRLLEHLIGDGLPLLQPRVCSFEPVPPASACRQPPWPAESEVRHQLDDPERATDGVHCGAGHRGVTLQPDGHRAMAAVVDRIAGHGHA